MTRTVALVGAAGGVGTTRLTLECGATLARAGRDVVVVDAAFATQGLAAHLDCRVDSDATALATGEAGLEAALYEHPVDLSGRLAVCPAAAPFEGLARAKTPGAAERLGDQVAAASLAHDVVLVDVPPVAANQAVAAIEAVERLALVTTDSHHGSRALARQQDRLADIGATPDAVLANRADSRDSRPVSNGCGRADSAGDRRVSESEAHAVSETDIYPIPESEVHAPEVCPVCGDPEAAGQFATAVAEAVEGLVGVSLGVDTASRGVLDRLVDI